MKHRLSRILSRTATTLTKEVGDISSVFPSLSGKHFEPLPPRYADLKREILGNHADVVEQSWTRLLTDLRKEIDELEYLGTKSIPSISYIHVENDTVTNTFLDQVRHRGVGVIRNVIDRETARDLKMKTEEYIAANLDKIKAFPVDNPCVYELYWSPAQVLARSHPHMLKTQSLLSSSLWHSSDPNSTISTTYPLTYADRLRIRRPGDQQFTLGPHIDGGGLERWEDPEYRSVYSSILAGDWESYDPYDAKHRIKATMDLYNGAGSCSMFRLFQGWLSMSSTAPKQGTLRVCPLLKHATAYLILRPFFTLQNSTLSSTFDPSTTEFPGSVPAACQEYTTSTHPHLELEHTMVSVPQVEPGDYVVWHCDTIHAVDPMHTGYSDSSVLYIPACALTEKNVEFLLRQREAAEQLSPSPDFPGAGGAGESQFTGRVDWKSQVDEEGLKAMGMGRRGWDVLPYMTEGEKRAVEYGNRVLFGS